MPLYVNYDDDGTILGVVEMPEVPEGVTMPVVPVGDHQVVELELDDETRDLDHGDLIQRYRIDTKSKKLIRRK